jgi:hypothetical protein
MKDGDLVEEIRNITNQLTKTVISSGQGEMIKTEIMREQ